MERTRIFQDLTTRLANGLQQDMRKKKNVERDRDLRCFTEETYRVIISSNWLIHLELPVCP
jgi:hypothetical protein